MEKAKVQEIARVLKILVMIAFVCAIIAVAFAPALSSMSWVDVSPYELLEDVASPSEGDDDFGFSPLFGLALLTVGAFSEAYTLVLTLFLMTVGVCAAVVLWQARRVLDTMIAGHPFDSINAVCMRRAGVCCLIIAAAALIRLIWGFCYYQSIAPLLTYNALFVPVFAMGFLLCMIMSALFTQAAEMKEENDLTI